MASYDTALYKEIRSNLFDDVYLDEEDEIVPDQPPEFKPLNLSGPRAWAREFSVSEGKAYTSAQEWSQKSIKWLNEQDKKFDPGWAIATAKGTGKELVKGLVPYVSGFAYAMENEGFQFLGKVTDNIERLKLPNKLLKLFIGNIGPKGTVEKFADKVFPVRKEGPPSALASWFYYKGSYWQKYQVPPKGILEKFAFAVGASSVALPKYALMSKMIGGPILGFAMGTYAETLDPIDAVKAAALGYVLEGTACMPMILKVPGVGAYAMVSAAVEGASFEDSLVSGVTFAALVAGGKSPTWKQWKAMGKETVGIADIRGLDAEPRRECIEDLTNVLRQRQEQMLTDPEGTLSIARQIIQRKIEQDRIDHPWRYNDPPITTGPTRQGLDVEREIGTPEKTREDTLREMREERGIPEPGKPVEKAKRSPVTAKEFIKRTHDALYPIKRDKLVQKGPSLKEIQAELEEKRAGKAAKAEFIDYQETADGEMVPYFNVGKDTMTAEGLKRRGLKVPDVPPLTKDIKKYAITVDRPDWVSPEQQAEIQKLREFDKKLVGKQVTKAEESELKLIGERMRAEFQGKTENPKPYEGLIPGTYEWKQVWKNHPELQDEMIRYSKEYEKLIVETNELKDSVDNLEVSEEEKPPLLNAEEEAKLQKEIAEAERLVNKATKKQAEEALKEHDSKLLEKELAELAEEQAYDRMGIPRHNRSGTTREFDESIKELDDSIEYDPYAKRDTEGERFENIKTEDTDVILSFLGLGQKLNELRPLYNKYYRVFERWIGTVKIGRYFVEYPGLTPEAIATFKKQAANRSVNVFEPAVLLKNILTKRQQERLLRRAKKFTKDERMLIGKLLRSNLKDGEADADLEIYEAAKFVREHLDYISELLVDILKAQPNPPQDLINEIIKNTGIYLRREFLKHTLPDFKSADQVIEDAINMFQENYTKGTGANKRPVTRVEAERMVDHLLNKGKSTKWSSEGIQGPRINKKFLSRKKPMNDVLDALYGLIEDPVYPVISTWLKTSQFVEDMIFFESLVKNPRYVSSERKEGYSWMEGERWGPLSQNYVKNEIKYVLETTYREPGPAMRALGHIMSRWKIIKVSGPKTWGRNVITNTIMFNISGTPMYEVFYWLSKAIREMLDQGPSFRQMKSIGGIDKTMGRHELEQFQNIVEKPHARYNIFYLFDGILRKFSKFYGGQENVYKLAKFMEVMKNPKRYKEDFKVFQEEKQGNYVEFANSEAQNWFFDYSVTSRFTKSLKNSFVPFITWQMKIAPRLIEGFAKHPISVLKYVMASGVFLAAAKKRINSLTDEDWKTVKKVFPDYLRRGQVLVIPFKDKNGRLRMIDLTFLMPGGFWLELFGGIYGAIREGQAFDALRIWAKTIGNPVLSTFVAWSSGRDPYTGRDLWDKDTLERDKWLNLLNYMANLALFSWMPGGYDFAKVRSLIRGEKDWATKSTEDWRWEVPGLFGMATTPMDIKKFYMQATVRISHKKEEIAKQRRIAKRALVNRKMSASEYKKRIAYLKGEYEKLKAEVKTLGQAKRIALEKGLWHLTETD